jgi:acyl-CoA reductase-like NAD-dependent aldehyde dehydrogenase
MRAGAATLSARNPRTGVEDYRFHVASRDEVASACAEVRSAQPAWQALGLKGRSAALQQLAEALTQNADALCAALALDTGRQRIARLELGGVLGMIANHLQSAPAVLDDSGVIASKIPGISARRQLVPYPVVGIIAPWNFPLILSLVDAIPALVAGCGVVLKPSEITPRYVEPLLAILAAVPQIADVVRIVRGPGSTGADVIDHVDAVVCTGSVRTGRLVVEHAARRFIPAFLELGGKDAAIVTASAPVDRAAKIALRAAVTATGQACQSLERVYVHEAIYAEFLARLLDRARQVRLTCDDPTGQVGPFILARQAEIVRGHIDDALALGARCELGGKIIERGGLWCEVTVLTEVTHAMKVMRDETFGPVIPVMRYQHLEEAIQLANDSDYGLSANVISGDPAEAEAIAARLNAGFVTINDASLSSLLHEFEWEGFNFSGLGRSRMGPSGIARYLRVKAIVTQSGEPSDIQDLRDTPA